MSDIAITLDIDWAPDFVIDTVAERLLASNVRATWFATHASDSLTRLRVWSDNFELGIHPNFLPGSSHGNTHLEVLNHCTAIVPEAVSMRSHGVYQCGSLYSDVLKNTKIKIDSTTFLPEMENIVLLHQYTPFGVLNRLPFFWADDYELCKPSSDWGMARFNNLQGIQIYLFHPIHIYLNSSSYASYESVKSKIPNISQATELELATYISQKTGVNNFFEQVIAKLKELGGGNLLREFVD